MTAKEEFFKLILGTFSEQQVTVVRELTERIEKERCPNDCTAFYLELCALYYSSCKNFDNFKLNLVNKQLPSDYTKFILQAEQKREEQQVQVYENIKSTVANATDSSPIYDSLKDRKESFTFALTNAITMEIIDQKNLEEALSYYKNCQQIVSLKKALDSGKQITRIGFDIERNASFAVIDNKTCISSFWNDLVNYSAYRMCLPDNIEVELNKLESQVKHSLKRIAIRICMVFVKYGILRETTTSEKFFLKNETGEFISLQQGVMTEIYRLMDKLHLEFKMQESEFKDIKNSKYTSDKIKSLLRAGKNTIEDDFCYSDINDQLWSCFKY